jgi:vacuolar-type H+-ATPase subunit F/Vma7
MKYEDLVEESISIAVTVLRKLSRQSTEVGFVYNGGNDNSAILLPTNKKGELAKVEKALAEYDIKNNEKPEKLEDVIKYVFEKNIFSEDTLLIFVTKNFNEKLYETIKKESKDYQSLVVVPIFRGDKYNEQLKQKSADNIKIFIKEVGRT